MFNEDLKPRCEPKSFFALSYLSWFIVDLLAVSSSSCCVEAILLWSGTESRSKGEEETFLVSPNCSSISVYFSRTRNKTNCLTFVSQSDRPFACHWSVSFFGSVVFLSLTGDEFKDQDESVGRSSIDFIWSCTSFLKREAAECTFSTFGFPESLFERIFEWAALWNVQWSGQ